MSFLKKIQAAKGEISLTDLAKTDSQYEHLIHSNIHSLKTIADKYNLHPAQVLEILVEDIVMGMRSLS